ncbi:hypothetical protein [Demequina activiva]|uniref:hypothetical protein n=1 Tax=Demequina activiva TaxID=1582364 RepID=UPI001945AE8A|nr:hypothetical protein [Demequina activiva]
MASTVTVLSVRLDRTSIDWRFHFRQLGASVLVASICGLVLWAVVSSAEFGRPGWWTSTILPLSAAGLLYLCGANVRAFLECIGVIPVVLVTRTKALSIGRPLGFVIGRRLRSPTGARLLLSLERSNRVWGRTPTPAITLYFKGTEGEVFSLAVAGVRLDYDWNAWARRAFDATPEIVVVDAAPSQSNLGA